MKILLSPGTTYVGTDGTVHQSGSVMDATEDEAESLIRTGSAVRMEGTTRTEGETAMRRKTDRGGVGNG